MSGGVPRRVQISRTQRNTPSKAGNVVAKKALVLCSSRRSRRAMCNYIKQRAKTCATCPPPSSDLEYNIVYEPQNIILPSQAAILVTSSSQTTHITLTVQYITRNGQTVWRPNDATSILKKVEFNMQQTDSNTNLIGHKMFVDNGSNKKLASFNVNTGAITFIPGDFPNATQHDGNSTGFDIRLTIKFVDPTTKGQALTTITKIGSIKVTTRVNAPSPPAGHSLSFNVIYNNSLGTASLYDLLNSSTGAVLSSGQSISFLELIGTGAQAVGKFELAPNFVQVAAQLPGTATSGSCPNPESGGTEEVPGQHLEPQINANFPVAQKLLNEAITYFIDSAIIKKGASFSGKKNNGGTIWKNNFDYGNPGFVTYFKHATGIATVPGWPPWQDDGTTQYLGNVNELEFIYSPTEYNQALVTKPQNKSILARSAVGGVVCCGPAPANNTGHSGNKDYIWSNAVPPNLKKYPHAQYPSYLGLYGLKGEMGAQFASLDIYFAGGESHASNGQFASEVTYSAIQNYEINTTGYCSKCGVVKPAIVELCNNCSQALPAPGEDFGTWQISRIGSAGDVSSLDLETFAHEVAHQIFYRSSDLLCTKGTASIENKTWLKNLKNAGGKTIPVIGVGGGKGGSIDVSFHSKLIPYLLYEMDAIFKDAGAGYGVKPEKGHL